MRSSCTPSMSIPPGLPVRPGPQASSRTPCPLRRDPALATEFCSSSSQHPPCRHRAPLAAPLGFVPLFFARPGRLTPVSSPGEPPATTRAALVWECRRAYSCNACTVNFVSSIDVIRSLSPPIRRRRSGRRVGVHVDRQRRLQAREAVPQGGRTRERSPNETFRHRGVGACGGGSCGVPRLPVTCRPREVLPVSRVTPGPQAVH